LVTKARGHKPQAHGEGINTIPPVDKLVPAFVTNKKRCLPHEGAFPFPFRGHLEELYDKSFEGEIVGTF